jgi:nitrogen-specific signal transduction histidine kinase
MKSEAQSKAEIEQLHRTLEKQAAELESKNRELEIEAALEKVREKIFQPFFTTKPTGSGTGLGLSLSYDIMKAHGGEMKVDSTEGLGSSFTLLFLLTE